MGPKSEDTRTYDLAQSISKGFDAGSHKLKMGYTKSDLCFIWKKCWKPVLSLLFPLILSLVFIWKGMTLYDEKVYKGILSIDKQKNYKRDFFKFKDREWLQPRAVYIVLLMSCYWVSECLPLPVTALTPIFLFPLFEIMDTERVCSHYLNNSVLLLLSGCMIALAIEYSNLHSRIALLVIKVMGAKIPFLLLGFILTAAFLSMWMNNTSTTAMMVPIVYVIMEEFANSAHSSDHVDADADKSVSRGPSKATVKAGKGPEVEVQAESKTDTDITPSTHPISTLDVKESTPTISDEQKKRVEKETRELKIMFLLAVAWGSNIGGTGTITGTATNVIATNQAGDTLKDLAKGTLEVKDRLKCIELLEGMNFLGWMVFNVPPMIVATLATYVILLIWFVGFPNWFHFWTYLPSWKSKHPEKLQERKLKAEMKSIAAKNIEKAIDLKYKQLGRISLHEILVLVFFIATALLWVTQQLWQKPFRGSYYVRNTSNKTGVQWIVQTSAKSTIHPAVPSVFISMLMFVVPKDPKYYKDFMNGGLAAGLKDTVLKFKLVETDVPWGPLVLIGGGLTISSGIRDSGLGLAIGHYLQNDALSKLPPYGFLIVILVLVACMTTVASNTATASILSPVLMTLAIDKGIHPRYFLEVATISASYAFILPISTPPNAIVFDKSDMKQKEMALPGIIVTIATNIVLFFMTHTYNELVYKFNEYNTPAHRYCMKPIDGLGVGKNITNVTTTTMGNFTTMAMGNFTTIGNFTTSTMASPIG